MALAHAFVVLNAHAVRAVGEVVLDVQPDEPDHG
jgi:hypothetical protein